MSDEGYCCNFWSYPCRRPDNKDMKAEIERLRSAYEAYKEYVEHGIKIDTAKERNAVIEECARLAQKIISTQWYIGADIVAAIRALKSDAGG